ncbi:MAG: lytic transglycosylase domain-containing protein [Armatimonadetes bacterium]|nr:lytic transglycosylase domain-containing protein [Armatimonadota bacterium]
MGYQAVHTRMAQLQMRLDGQFGKKTEQGIGAPAMNKSAFAGMSGSIGDGNEPMSPFGGGKSVDVDRAPAPIQAMIRDAATSAGVDFELLEALVGQESSFKQESVSRAGAIGLAQLMPGTAKALGVNPNDPAQNLMGGAKYLGQLMKQFGGDTEKALAAYNAGPGAVTKYNGVPPFQETQDYVRKVIARYQAIRKP